MSIPIVVLASGRGSGFSAIAAAVRTGQLAADIRLLLSDREGAPVLDKARHAGIEAVCEPLGNPRAASREEHEKRLLAQLRKVAPRFLVLAGFMRRLTPAFIAEYRNRIVNVHPSLLPAFPGMNSYAQAFRYGAKVSGVTVHLVEAQVDAGPICAQEAFSIADCKSEAEVEERGLKIEHRLYPATLDWVLRENFTLVEREGRTCVCQN